MQPQAHDEGAALGQDLDRGGEVVHPLVARVSVRIREEVHIPQQNLADLLARPGAADVFDSHLHIHRALAQPVHNFVGEDRLLLVVPQADTQLEHPAGGVAHRGLGLRLVALGRLRRRGRAVCPRRGAIRVILFQPPQQHELLGVVGILAEGRRGDAVDDDLLVLADQVDLGDPQPLVVALLKQLVHRLAVEVGEAELLQAGVHRLDEQFDVLVEVEHLAAALHGKIRDGDRYAASAAPDVRLGREDVVEHLAVPAGQLDMIQPHLNASVALGVLKVGGGQLVTERVFLRARPDFAQLHPQVDAAAQRQVAR